MKSQVLKLTTSLVQLVKRSMTQLTRLLSIDYAENTLNKGFFKNIDNILFFLHYIFIIRKEVKNVNLKLNN